MTLKLIRTKTNLLKKFDFNLDNSNIQQIFQLTYTWHRGILHLIISEHVASEKFAWKKLFSIVINNN